MRSFEVLLKFVKLRWGSFGVRLEFVWGSFGVHQGSFGVHQSSFGVRQTQSSLGVCLSSIGVRQGSFGVRLEFVFVLVWSWFGVRLVFVWSSSKSMKGSFRFDELQTNPVEPHTNLSDSDELC